MAGAHSRRNPAADAPSTILEHLDTALSCAQKDGPSVAGSRGDVGTIRSPVQNSIGGRPRSLAWRASCHIIGERGFAGVRRVEHKGMAVPGWGEGGDGAGASTYL